MNPARRASVFDKPTRHNPSSNLSEKITVSVISFIGIFTYCLRGSYAESNTQTQGKIESGNLSVYKNSVYYCPPWIDALTEVAIPAKVRPNDSTSVARINNFFGPIIEYKMLVKNTSAKVVPWNKLPTNVSFAFASGSEKVFVL